MAAGFERAKDTRGDINFVGQGIGTIVSKTLAAKVLARKEREYAERKAEEQGIDIETFNSMFGRGYFFKKALAGEMGGNALKKKKQELAQAYRKTLLVGKITTNPRLRKRVFRQLEDSAFYSKGKQKQFRKQFDYTNYEEYFGEDEAVPSTAQKTRDAVDPTRAKRVSREQIAESISKMAESINRAAQAISQSSASVYGTLITANTLQADVANDLKHRNDTLETKLQGLIDAINNQTTEQKEYIDKTEDKASEASLEKKEVAAAAAVADDLRTEEDESREYSTVESEEIDGSPPMMTAEQQRDALREQWLQQKPPQAEEGGIFSGPDSGYLVELHGNEAVIPLDNNYTQGEPSAVDGKVRPKPQTPVFNKNISSAITNINRQESQETSITNRQESQETSITPRFTKTDMFEGGTEISMAPNISTGDVTQPLSDVMSLPFTAVGGGMLAANKQMLESMGPDAERIAPQVNQMSRTIASVYGVPNSLARSVESGPETTPPETEGDVEETKPEYMKVFEFFKDAFSNFLEALGMKISKSTPSPGPSTPPPVGTTASDLGSFIGAVESNNDYTKIVGGSTDSSILGKSITQLDQEHGGQHALGRYQIQMRTAKGILQKNNIDASTFKFDQAGQDRLFQMLLEHRGLNEYLAGTMTEDEFAVELSKEWASLPENSNNLSYYHGDGRNKAHRTYEQTIQQIRMLKTGMAPSRSAMPELAPSNESATRLNNAQQIAQRAKQPKTSVVSLNSSGETQQPPSAGAADTPGEEVQIGRGLNPLDNSGIYIG